MKADPNIQKSHTSIKVVINQKQCQEPSPKNLSQFSEKKQILDLLMAPMSPNQVSRHLNNVFRIQRKAHKIRQVLLRNKHRILLLNNKFDLIAIPTLTLLEIDETFKGCKISMLVVVDTFTGYIFSIQWLKERSKEGILQALAPIQHLFLGVMLVLTDGAPYFPEVIKELCPNAKHQICLIHIMRGLYPLIRPFQAHYMKVQRMLSETKAKLKKKQAQFKVRQKTLKLWKAKRKYRQNIRNEIRIELGIRPYQKKVLRDYPILKEINQAINKLQPYIRGDEISIQNHKKSIKSLKEKVQAQESEKNQVWGEYLRQCNYLHRFYNLFHFTEQKYEKKRDIFLNSLQSIPKRHQTDLMKKIVYVLTTVSNLDTVNKANSPVRLTRNYINTNVIESANSKIRPHLDHFRNIRNTEYCETYFNLLRLKLNTSRPFSGPRSNTSPIERYGYNLRGRSWLDIIFDGLPSGSQTKINSSQLDLIRACPQRVGKCKIRR
jgi:transposase-like protein